MEIIDKRNEGDLISNAKPGDVLASGNRYWYVAYDDLTGKLLILNFRNGRVIYETQVKERDINKVMSKRSSLGLKIAKHVKLVIE